MPTIELRDRASVAEIALRMKRKERFAIVTSDPEFNPLATDRHSAEVWVASAGGGALMTIGAGAILLAFLDPEPTSKLTALVVGGVLMALAGGGVIMTILVTRARYTSHMDVDPVSGRVVWSMAPR